MYYFKNLLMLTVKESYDKLLKSEKFLNKGFFCSAFIMCEDHEIKSSDWQLDFYEEKSDTITSYIVGKEVTVLEQQSKVFKEEDTSIKPLKLDNVVVGFDKVMDKVNEVIKLKHESTVKFIIILQQQEVTLWNISSFTNSFKLINFKIDASTGRLICEEVVPLLSLDGRNEK